MSKNDQEAVDRLRTLILGDGIDRIENFEREIQELRSRLTNEEELISSLDPVIADLLERKINFSKDDMAEALSPIMSEAIKRQITETKEDVVDALYPVIGQTIRKSVSQAMKDMVYGVNSRIEKAIVRKLLPRKLRARLLGVPESELLVSESLPFDIEQIFLIHKETGILISHVTAEGAESTVDQELVSGMLTAIRDFVSEAFQQDQKQDLSEIEYGDSKILLEIGRYSYIAMVVTGMEPAGFRKRLGNLDRRIHHIYYKELRQFDGDLTPLQEIDRELLRFIKQHPDADTTEPQRKKPKPYHKYGLVIVLLVILIFLAFKVPPYLQKRELLYQVESSFALLPDADVDFYVDNDTLLAEGTVNSFWMRDQIDSIATSISGVNAFRNLVQVSIKPPQKSAILAQIKRNTAVFDSLQFYHPTFIVDRDHVSIQGYVPDARIKREVGYLVSLVDGVRLVTNDAFILNENNLSQANHYLNRLTIFFDPDSVHFIPDQNHKIDQVVDFYSNLPSDRIKLLVRGFAYEKSDYYKNLRLSQKRAEYIGHRLAEKNISKKSLVIISYGEKYPLSFRVDHSSQSNKNSRVEFDLITGEEHLAAGHQ